MNFSTIISIIVGGILGWNLEFLLSWVEGDGHVKRSRKKDKESVRKKGNL